MINTKLEMRILYLFQPLILDFKYWLHSVKAILFFLQLY